MAGDPEVIIIKKKAKGHGSHGAAWKVAYADFVTAMMALFMVLWLVSQTDQKIKKAISDYFRTGVFSGAPSILEGGMGVADHGFVDTLSNPGVMDAFNNDASSKFLRDAVRKALVKVGTKGLADRVTVTASKGGTLIQVAEGQDDLLFDLSSAELKPPLTKLLAALAPELTKLGELVEIHGHTDARPFASGTGRNNWTLSFERAENARAELQKNGLPDKLIGGMFAHAATQPIDPDPNARTNRRLAIFARHAPQVAAPPGSGKPAGSAKPAESGRPAESAKPAESGKRGESEKKDESAKPAASGALGESPKGAGSHDESPHPEESAKPAVGEHDKKEPAHETEAPVGHH